MHPHAIEATLTNLEERHWRACQSHRQTRRDQVAPGQARPAPDREATDAWVTMRLTEQESGRGDPEMGRLLRATGVAGFAAMNIMMLSISVWSGSDDTTKNMFHLISGAVATPGAGLFRPHLLCVGVGSYEPGAPIWTCRSASGCCAFGLSVYGTLTAGPHAYFDAVTSLLFFLAGRLPPIKQCVAGLAGAVESLRE